MLSFTGHRTRMEEALNTSSRPDCSEVYMQAERMIFQKPLFVIQGRWKLINTSKCRDRSSSRSQFFLTLHIWSSKNIRADNYNGRVGELLYGYRGLLCGLKMMSSFYILPRHDEMRERGPLFSASALTDGKPSSYYLRCSKRLFLLSFVDYLFYLLSLDVSSFFLHTSIIVLFFFFAC
jgi:hypothetical protein